MATTSGMSRASAIPAKSCLKRPRNAPSPGSAESSPPTKKHVTFGVSVEVSIPQEGQGMQKTKKPSLLPPMPSRPEDESDQITLARKRTALCQKLLPVRNNMLKLKKSKTVDAEDMDAESLARIFLTGASRADNEEDATLLKDAVAKMYRDIFAKGSYCEDQDAAQGSEAVPNDNETVGKTAGLSTIEATSTSETDQYSTQATATSNEGTDFEANNAAEHGQVKVADARVCRIRNKEKWIVDSRATVEGQLDLQHATSVAEWWKIPILHREPCVKSLAPPLLGANRSTVAHGVRPLVTLLGQRQPSPAPIMPRKEISIAQTDNTIDYDSHKGDEKCNTSSNETQREHHRLVFHHGRLVGILTFRPPASIERQIREAPPIILGPMDAIEASISVAQ
ncbi:hypothetical protein HII31_09025 [Pseudocercospora fuligena]|uniref:Uncharacterized protein n=1 Tax=Pseudocercospora fuligena TaxID=685502 RepID=A0A8H6REE3_9PEZI|nr:hypothetical protein HII31_09025 [Pseudocercospora fuligena]